MRTSRSAKLAVALGLLVASAGFALAQEASPHAVVINEAELNPAGFDTGAEWVELLNTGDVAVDLAGWSLSFSYRGPGTLLISETPLSLGPGRRYVFVYPGLRLRNVGGTPISLLDADGNVVDQGPSMTDEADDNLTWQRWPDGGDPAWPDLWLFREATRNAPIE